MAHDIGVTSTVLNTLFHRAIATGKRVRTETRIAFSAVSVSYAAVELAREIFGDLAGCGALIYGAGRMAELTVENLTGRGVGKIYIANHHRDKAEEMAAILGGRMEDASDFSGRIDVYGMSWREFLAHPIWGTNDLTRLGGHAYWIDVLGQWGIIGFIAEMLMMIAAFRCVRKILPRSTVYYYVISFGAFIVICFFKAGAFHAQTPVLFGMAVPMLLFREDDFYAASNNIRRIFRLPPRMFAYGRFL